MAGIEGNSAIEDVRRIKQETTYRDLINLSEDELRRRFDLLLFVGDDELSVNHYRDEIQRRAIAKQSQRLEGLTEALVVLTHRLHRLTLWVVILTVVLVVLEVLRIAGAGH